MPKVDITHSDVALAGFGPVPESATRLAGLVTKAAMGLFLTYFSVNELLVELHKYRHNLRREALLDDEVGLET